MSILATLARNPNTLPGDHYRCTRCGHEAKYNRSRGRGRPDLCRDCTDVQTTTTFIEAQS